MIYMPNIIMTEITKQISAKTSEFLSNRKKANLLVDVLLTFQENDIATTVSCIKNISMIFVTLLTRGELYLAKNVTNLSDDKLTADQKYCIWLRERYNDFTQRLCQLLCHSDNRIQKLSFHTVKKLLETECAKPLQKCDIKDLTFPQNLVERMVVILLNGDVPISDLIADLITLCEYDDFRWVMLSVMLKVVKEIQHEQQVPATFHDKFLELLESITMPKGEKNDDRIDNMMCPMPYKEHKVFSVKEQRKLYSTVVLTYLQFKLPASMYKRILLTIHKSIMPNMASPLMLANFLTECLNLGGVIGLLALSGILELVMKNNLEYPDLFVRLYGLLDISMLHVKYRSRFLEQVDLFLSSTLLASYIVAAFAKKLARMCLYANPDAIVIVIPLIYNLIRRHPSITFLIHNSTTTDLSTDPYNIDEADPKQSRALESSLWELKTLESHYYPPIVEKAKKSANPLEQTESKLKKLLDTDINSLYHSETKKRVDEVPVTFDKPKGLFGNKNDTFSAIWSME